MKLPIQIPGSLAQAWRTRADNGRDAATRYWKQLAPREQLLLRVAGLLLGLALCWLLAVRPAVTSIGRWHQDLPQLRATAAQVDALLREARALRPRPALAMSPEQWQTELQASLAAVGGSVAIAALPMPAGQTAAAPTWEVSLQAVDAARLFEWLADAPWQFQLRPVQADLMRAATPQGKPQAGKLSGRLRLAGVEEAAR